MQFYTQSEDGEIHTGEPKTMSQYTVELIFPDGKKNVISTDRRDGALRYSALLLSRGEGRVIVTVGGKAFEGAEEIRQMP